MRSRTIIPLCAATLALLLTGCPTVDPVDDDDDDATEPEPTPACDPDALEPLPVAIDRIDGVVTEEDFALAADGSLISVDPNGNLVRNLPDGGLELIAPGVSDESAGVAILPDGGVVVADVWGGGLVHVDPETGGQRTLLAGLSYPNGVAVHRDGWVAVAEHDGGRVRRVDPESGDSIVLADDLYNPNGLTFAPDWSALYVGSFGGGTVHAIALDEDGEAGDVKLWARMGEDSGGGDDWEDYGTDGLDGIATDACGNVYVTAFAASGGNVFRFTGPGAEPELVADVPASWVPNLEFGNGVGPWEPTTLYVSSRDDDSVYALDIGVPGRPMASAP